MESMASTADRRQLQAIQNAVLEMIAYGEPLEAVAATLCQSIEEVAPEAVCSVLAVDEDGLIHAVASPSLPDSYSGAIEGLSIGPRAGSCGTCAHRGEPVLTEDIATDPLWDEYRWLVVPTGLKACWSSPVKTRGGRVIGTFALYFREKRGPNEVERRAVDTCVHLCAIAMEQAEIHSRIHRLAYFDILTGLPNRFNADVLLTQRAASAPRGLGILLLDIDNLKITNDTLGHAAGDELIKQVATRIAAVAAPGVACRIGGDEFMMILDDCHQSGGLKAISDRVLEAMQPPFVFQGSTIVPHVTIGGALYGRDGTDIDTLRQNADLALYQSKERARGGFVEFREPLRATMTRRVQQVKDVGAALSDGRIVAHYQPIVQLDTGRFVGLEALARLVLPSGRILAAAHFHDAISEPSIARRFADQMLNQVTFDLSAWMSMGIPIERVGINFSSPDLQSGELADRIAAAFARAAIPLSRLTLEVTEGILLGGSEPVAAETIGRLRAQGVRVALDDFGTGYASLTHLLTMPVDILKIDKSFIRRLTQDTASEVIVTALVDIAGKLGMRIAAEGIETEDQLARLRALGCNFGQGFGLYRPASFEDTTARLLDNLGTDYAAESAERAPGASKRNAA